MHLRRITLVFRQQNKNYNLTFIMDNIIGCGGENRGSHGGFAFPMDNIIAAVIPCSPEQELQLSFISNDAFAIK
jgi:hypothetical protein